MTVSRIRRIVLAAAFVAASGTTALAGDQATAPPRALGDTVAATAQSTASKSAKGGAKDDSGIWGNDQPPDVDTSDLKSDVPEPLQGVPEAPATSPMLPPKPPTKEVEEESLGALEGPVAGLLGPGDGGFDENIWSGSKRADIEFLLPHIPLVAQDSAVHALAKRLILTKAEAPMGNIVRPIIAIRVEKLLEAGLADDAAALSLQATLHGNADFERLKADAILMAGGSDDACGPGTASRQTANGQFWLQLRTYCAAVSGDSATADITRGVLDAQMLGDPAFDALLDDVLNKTKKPPGPIARPTAMHFFLIRRAGLLVNLDVAKHLGMAADLAALRDPHQTPAARLAAAERSAKSGAAGVAELRAVLDAQKFPSEKLARADEVSGKLSFLGGQGLLRRAAQLESRQAGKGTLVHRALTEADKVGMFEVAARLQADLAEKLDAAAVAPADAPLIGWALLMAGKPDAAAKFLGDGDAARAVLALASGKDDAPALAAVAKQFSADPKAPNRVRGFEALVLGIADVLDLPMPPDAGAAAKSAEGTHWPGRRLDSQQMETIVATSAAPGRKGEAILRILEAIGPEGPRDLAPDVTIELVRALADMGVKDAARAIGMHAILLYRPGTS